MVTQPGGRRLQGVLRHLHPQGCTVIDVVITRRNALAHDSGADLVPRGGRRARSRRHRCWPPLWRLRRRRRPPPAHDPVGRPAPRTPRAAAPRRACVRSTAQRAATAEPAARDHPEVPIGGGVILDDERIVVTQPSRATSRRSPRSAPTRAALVGRSRTARSSARATAASSRSRTARSPAGPRRRGLAPVAIKIVEGRSGRSDGEDAGTVRRRRRTGALPAGADRRRPL